MKTRLKAIGLVLAIISLTVASYGAIIIYGPKL